MYLWDYNDRFSNDIFEDSIVSSKCSRGGKKKVMDGWSLACKTKITIIVALPAVAL